MPLERSRRCTHNESSSGHHSEAKDANKSEIKKAVEQLFGVEVAKVNTMNCNGRSKRVGRFAGKTSDWKKAIITLTEDSKSIEFFEGMV